MAARSGKGSSGLSADDIDKMLAKKMRGYRVRRPEAHAAVAADADFAFLVTDEVVVRPDAGSPTLDYLRAKFLRGKGAVQDNGEHAPFVTFSTDDLDEVAVETEDEAIPAEDDLELVVVERDDDNIHTDLGRDRRVVIVSKSKKKIVGAQG